MEKTQNKIFTAFFMLVLFSVPVLTFILPHEAYNETERRMIADTPAFTVSSGVYSKAVEDYLSDRLPLRKEMTGINAYRQQLSGLGITGEVLYENGALNEKPVSYDEKKLIKNMNSLLKFAQKAGQTVYLVTPPTAGFVRSESGNASLLSYPDQEIFSIVKETMQDAFVDTTADFILAGSDAYYSTDPHWNMRGAYVAYRALCEKFGIEPLPESAFTVTKSEGFYGTCYSRSALWLYPSDTLEMWDAGDQLSVTIDENTQDGVFYREHLATSDQYPVYLDGNHGLTIIKNASCDNGKRLLLIKDSYGNSLATLLSHHYSETVLIDLRAYRKSVSDLGAFDDIAAVYCVDRLCNDDNLAWLR